MSKYFPYKTAVRYVFCIAQDNISRLFNAAIVKSIIMESIDTTNNNMIEEGAVVVCLLLLVVPFS